MIKSKKTGVLLAAFVFIIGLACGLLMDRVFMFHKIFPIPARLNQRQEERMAKHVMDHLNKQLALTEDQKNKIAPILKKHKDEMDDMAKTVRAKFRDLKAKMDVELVAVLDDNQKIKFEKMRKEHEEKEAKEAKQGVEPNEPGHNQQH